MSIHHTVASLVFSPGVFVVVNRWAAWLTTDKRSRVPNQIDGGHSFTQSPVSLGAKWSQSVRSTSRSSIISARPNREAVATGRSANNCHVANVYVTQHGWFCMQDGRLSLMFTTRTQCAIRKGRDNPLSLIFKAIWSLLKWNCHVYQERKYSH